MKIACVLITHLPMKAELRRHADLRGKPVIITEGSDSSQIVLDRSPEATGVFTGMPLQEALSRCKGATLLQADEPYYQKTFNRVLVALSQRSPLVERAEIGCAYVGLDGLDAMYGGEPRLISALSSAVPSNLNPRIGVAGGKFPAYVAAMGSRGGGATRVPEGGVAEFLQRFPVDLLPLSWDDKVRLRRFGLHTIGQLAALSVGAVQAQFGPEGKVAWELSNGTDTRPLLPHKPEDLISEHLTFPSPTATLQTIMVGVETLLGKAFSRPNLRGRYARTATLEGTVMQKPPWTRHFAFKEPVSSKARALPPLRNMLESVSLPGPLEDMTLVLAGFTGESGIQASLFLDIRRQEQLREMMRQLEVRLRRKPPIYHVRDIEPWSRIPERRQALIQYDP